MGTKRPEKSMVYYAPYPAFPQLFQRCLKTVLGIAPTDLRSCVKVEVAGLGSSSLIVPYGLCGRKARS